MDRLAALAFTAALALLPVAMASAQTVNGVTIGAPIPDDLPSPVAAQVQEPFAFTLHEMPDQSTMSVIADTTDDTVVFVELRNTTVRPSPSAIHGLAFGETTRADLHARYGSEGIVFADVGRTAVAGEVAAFFTTYEIEDSDVVVAFTTVMPIEEASEDSADQSLLDSIVIGENRYLDIVWGVNRGRLPGYAPITGLVPTQ